MDGQKSLRYHLYSLHQGVNMEDTWCCRNAFVVFPQNFPNRTWTRNWVRSPLNYGAIPSQSQVTTHDHRSVAFGAQGRNHGTYVVYIRWCFENSRKPRRKNYQFFYGIMITRYEYVRSSPQKSWIRHLIYPPCILTMFPPFEILFSGFRRFSFFPGFWNTPMIQDNKNPECVCCV